MLLGLCLFCFSSCFLVSVFKSGNLVHWQALDQKLNPGIIDHGCGVEVVGLSGAHWLALQGGRQTSRCVYVIGIQQILAKKWINECHLREINLSAACKVGWKAETLELGRTIRGLLHNLRMQILGPTEGKWCWGQKKWREKSESVEEDI